MKRIRAVFLTVIIVIAGAMAVSYFTNFKKNREAPKSLPAVKLTPVLAYETDEVALEVPPAWRSAEFGVARKLRMPKGWQAKVFSSRLDDAGFFAKRGDGVLYISLPKEGKIMALPDSNGDGVADRAIMVLSGLEYPSGIFWDGPWLYVALNAKIMRYRDLNGDYLPDIIQNVVPNLPEGGDHISHSIVLGADRKLYVSVGSSCNVCVDEPRRATILRYTADGEDEEVYASGLRDVAGLAFDPETGELYATDRGRDFLGGDRPSDEINVIKQGSDYGWPACFEDRLADPDLKPEEGYCEKTESPLFTLQAHSAPTGMVFLRDQRLPDAYRGGLLLALHGSGDPGIPAGYKLVRARTAPTGELVIDEFITGWLEGAEAWGRPTDLIIGADGAIYVSDDRAGAVYRFIPPEME